MDGGLLKLPFRKKITPVWKIVDSDSIPVTLSLAGTEGERNLSKMLMAPPGNTKCLLAYVLYGKNRDTSPLKMILTTSG